MNTEFPHNLPGEDVQSTHNSHRKEGAVSAFFETWRLSSLKRQSTPELLTKVSALVGVVALLSLGAWGVTLAARSIPEGFIASAVVNLKSTFISNEEGEIILVLETIDINSGEDIALSWENTSNEQGTYALRYACAEGVSVTIKTASEEREDMLCDALFDVGEATSATLAITSSQEPFEDVSISVVFFPFNEEREALSDDGLITVINTGADSLGDVRGTAPAPSNVSAGVPSSETEAIGGGSVSAPTFSSDPNGTPDLRVVVLNTGIVDKQSNFFTPGVPVEQNSRAGIHFYVENVGSKASGEWSFGIDLPLAQTLYVYRPRETQRSLNPGERIEYTLGFDQINRTEESATAVINIDPTHDITDANRANNSAEAVFVTG